MKNIRNNLFYLTILMSLFFVKGNAQEIKSLKIIYDITYPAKKAALKSANFKNAVALIHDATSLVKIFTEDDNMYTTLTNDCGETNLSSLANMPPHVLIKGDKNLAKNTFEKFAMPLPKIKVTTETKQILGYSCKKVLQELKINDSTTTKSYFYIYEIPDPSYCVNYFNFDGGIKGIMLSQELNLGDGTIQVWTATSFSEELIDSNVFIVPSNYEIISNEEYTQKLMKDSSFRKKTMEFTEEYKKERKKEFWNNFTSTLLEKGLQVVQEAAAYQKLAVYKNKESEKDFTKITMNNLTKDSKKAVKDNQTILQNSSSSASPISSKSSTTSESSAVTNGGNGGFNQNAGAAKRCADATTNEWKKNTKEYQNYIDNPGCNKMAEISKKKLAEMLLQSCRQYLPQSEIDGFNKSIISLNQLINGMPDCKTYNYGR